MALSINKISEFYTRLNLYYQQDSYISDKTINVICQTGYGLDSELEENGSNHVDRVLPNEKTTAKLLQNDKKDNFITKYNDVIASNFGFLFDVKV